MENDQTPGSSKDSETAKLKNASKGKSPKRKRKAVYLDEETIKLLETVKAISSYTKTQDTVILKRALKYVLYYKQDLNDTFEKPATLKDLEKNNKKHIGKLNAAFEIFQSETFQNNQFVIQHLKQLLEHIAKN
ncbi:MAG: hypothetical protein JWN76_1963 [Chitinophagaceae bacterium]|nr:hypothetical protein [Chitinophagaceae bacterium]